MDNFEISIEESQQINVEILQNNDEVLLNVTEPQKIIVEIYKDDGNQIIETLYAEQIDCIVQVNEPAQNLVEITQEDIQVIIGENKVSLPSGGNVFGFTAGEPISAFQPVALINGVLFQASNLDPSQYCRVIGIAVTSATNIGEPVEVQQTGRIINFGFAFAVGSLVYVGASGVTDIKPTNEEYIKVLGHVEGVNTIFLDLQPSVLRA